MLYPFMTLKDGTEIVHSESMQDSGREKVKVCIEKPVDWGFKSAICWLPDYQWEKVDGFTPEEIDDRQALVQSLAHVIIEPARNRGFEQATAIVNDKYICRLL